MSTQHEHAFLSPREVAGILRVSHQKVLDLIADGHLVAHDIRGRNTNRPLWRISVEGLDAFLKSRTPQPRPVQARRKAKPSKTYV